MIRELKRELQKVAGGGRLYDWWNFNQVKNVSKKDYTHPCIMPLKVMENIIGILPDDKTIIDCFMGANTTGIACMKLGRNYIGIEIDKTYYEEAVMRANKYKEQKL